MKYELFAKLYREARDRYDREDMFIAERGWQDWMDDYDEEKIAPILYKIWQLGKADIAALRGMMGLNKTEFAARYGIPYRTAQNWELKGSGGNAPAYLIELIAYTVFEEWLENA